MSLANRAATQEVGRSFMVDFSKRRMHRIFGDDGRCLIVAMDHGLGANVHPHLADPGSVLDAAVQGGADAILSSAGVLKSFASRFQRLGVILRADGGHSALLREGGQRVPRRLYSVEDALRLGADAIACMGFPGTPGEAESLGNLAALTSQAAEWSVPVMAEMLPGGFRRIGAQHTPENIRLAVRIGAEFGADFIKTKFVGPVAAFREVVRHSYRPILVLGGNTVDDPRACLTQIKQAMDSGARGAVIGRNIWGHGCPQRMVRALSRIIHGGSSIDAAAEELVDS